MKPLPPVHPECAKLLNHLSSPGDSNVTEVYKKQEEAVRLGFSEADLPKESREKYAHLVPVYQNGQTNIPIRNGDQRNIIKPLHDTIRRPDQSCAVVPSLEDFRKNIVVFTGNALEGLDHTDKGRLAEDKELWENVVVAGGAVVASILPPQESVHGSGDLGRYYDKTLAPELGVELFFYGLNSKKDADAKTTALAKRINSAVYHKSGLVVTGNAVTVVSECPTRHVRIVQTRYRTIAEILTSFDVDCSCVAYDGQQVYASPRAIAAYVTQSNPINLTYHLPGYEHRLFMYARLGFGIFCPDVDRTQVDPNIFERFPQLSGLARLLFFERFPRGNANYISWRQEARFGHDKNYKNYANNIVPGCELLVEESGSSTEIIPYGKGWDAEKITDRFKQTSIMLSTWKVPSETMEILEKNEPSIPTGQQQIAANLRRESRTRWTGTEMAYVGVSDTSCQAIVSKQLEDMKRVVDQDQVNRLDCTGRTPLHLACMTSTPDIVKHLLEEGALLDAETADGRTAWHLAAARGDSDILKALHGAHDDGKSNLVNQPALNNFATPLHLAILFGHCDAVRILVEEFGADITLGLTIPGKRPGEVAGVIPTLALPLFLPPKDSSTMWDLLWSLRADQENKLLPHYIVQFGSTEFLESYVHAKSRATFTTDPLNSLCRILGSRSPDSTDNDGDQRVVVSSPLTGAIAARDQEMALALLKGGANPSISDPDGTLDAQQPIVMAIEANMPSLAIELLGHGATVAHAGKLLNMVAEWLKKLNNQLVRRNALCIDIHLPKRREPAPDLLKGTYQDFLVGLELEERLSNCSRDIAGKLRSEEFDASPDNLQDLIEGYRELQERLRNMVKQYDVPEATLDSHTCGLQAPCVYVPHDTACADDRMFEAAWTDQMDTIGEKTVDLTKRDRKGFTCLALAALRNLGTAEEIKKQIVEKYANGQKIIYRQLRDQYPVGSLVKACDLPKTSSTIWERGQISLNEAVNLFEIDTLSKYAIVEDDCKLLRFLVSATSAQRLDNHDPYLVEDVELAISLNRQGCIKIIIEETGIGCLASNSPGANSVATAPVQILDGTGAAEREHPLLISARKGHQLICSFLNDDARSHYKIYVDKRVKDTRGESPCWLPEAIKRLVLHYAVMSQPCEESENLLRYLLNCHGQYMEEKAFGGRTPLAMACSLHRWRFAEILIENKANIDALDTQGRNLLHLMLFSMPKGVCVSSRDLKPIANLLPEDIVSRMLDETTNVGSMTPFALWVHAYSASEDKVATDIPAYILSLKSKGHLEIPDALGNTPMHTVVANGLYSALEAILTHRPDLLYRENATGITPMEVAQDRCVKSLAHRLVERTLWDLYNTELAESKREPSIETRVWELCSKHQRSGELTRRLATLEEAQTAARLTSELKGKGIHDMIEEFCGDKKFWKDMIRRL